MSLLLKFMIGSDAVVNIVVHKYLHSNNLHSNTYIEH